MATPRVHIVLPAHRNGVVRDVLLPVLNRGRNILVLEPLAYPDFTRLMSISGDRGNRQRWNSGRGAQPRQAGPGHAPVDRAARGVTAGTAQLVGTSPKAIVEGVELLIRDKFAYRSMAKAINPSGDGCAARRTADALNFFFKQGPAPQDFEPSAEIDDRRNWPDADPVDLPTASLGD